jgi:hypothetical protein
MIDKITISGAWGPVQEHHFKRLAQVSYSRFLQSKTKQTTTFIDSPLTGAQISVVYVVKNVAGIDIGYVEITIALASALIGHNYLHAGLEVINHEIRCLKLLLKILLTAIGMEPEKIERYIQTAEVLLCEVTWHTLAASSTARQACQSRTITYLNLQRQASSRHDVQVTDVDVRDSKSGRCMLVSLKTGDAFRQYCKADQLKARRKGIRSGNFASISMRPKLAALLPMLSRQVRNELIFGAETLKASGLSDPRNWHAATIESAIDLVWGHLGLAGNVEKQLKSGTAEQTLQRYLSGEDLTKSLPPYRISRDRKAIKLAGGPDIGAARAGLRFKAANLGRQLQYARRWKLLGELRDLVVSERTAPALMEELQQGLDFITDGVLPDIADPARKADWLRRWIAFAQKEHIAGNFRAHPALTDSGAVSGEAPDGPTLSKEKRPLAPLRRRPPTAGPIRSSRGFGRGIGRVIVDLSDDDGFDPYLTAYD